MEKEGAIPLIQPVLAGALTRVLGSPSDQAARKAQEWAQAYRDYAITAMAGILLPIFTGLEQAAMVSMLLPVMTNFNTTTPQFARALAGGVESFWLLPPVLFSGGVLAGAAALFPGKEPLAAMLTVIMSRPQDRYEGVAQQIATALDTATRTVVVNFAPPPGSTVTLT